MLTEVLFYHLQQMSLERVLPGLLEKTLERGWRAVVQADTRERVEVLDALLWTFRDESFLPHGMSGDKQESRQPIFLTTDVDNPNGASVRFLVDGAAISNIADYQRVVFMFDGNETQSVEHARDIWRSVKTEGHEVSYWQQDEAGRWENKA